MIVLKFGGTSVGSATMMDRALDIVQSYLPQAPVLVASAMAKVTDRLVQITEIASTGDEHGARTVIDQIAKMHMDAAEAFLTGPRLEKAGEALRSYLGELSSLTKGLSLLHECTPRSSDAILSFGELMSTTIVACRAEERGIPVDLLDARDFVRTDARFTGATPDMAETTRLVREKVRPLPGRLIVTQGFIARNGSGATTTLGRGGSDYSATIIGCALGVETVQIWTDVNGIMTSDPRVVSDAKTIDVISYAEAAELAYFGAKVVHPSTIQPAVETGIPVQVKNTMDPDGAGTVIVGRADGTGLRAIAGKKDITLIHISSTRMLNAYGFLSRIFATFERHRTPVDLVATSEVSVSMSIDNAAALDSIIKDLGEIGVVNVEGSLGIICLVGQDLWKDSSFLARVFGALRDTPIRMISLGSSDINLSLVVPRNLMDAAIQTLHREFF